METQERIINKERSIKRNERRPSTLSSTTACSVDAGNKTVATDNKTIQDESKRRKIVIVGDGAIGKTSLIAYFQTGEFLDTYIPTVFENALSQVDIGTQIINLEIWDTAGQDEYTRLRPFAYTNAHAVILCFAIDRLDSFNNINQKWLPELKHYCNGLPIMLIGLKSDLRNNSKVDDYCVPRERALELEANEVVAKYMECSAKTGVNIIRAMETVALLSLETGRARRKKCCIL
ncbi:ras family-domain-containing protein [Globomyces pollinis-pini]|nr:ras family-domain-containing protein [Globomyces pollinis-pini]